MPTGRRKDEDLRFFVIFRGETEKTKRRNFASFHYFVFSPRNNKKTKIIVISWRKDDKLRGKKTLNSGSKRRNFVSFRPFIISSFCHEITKRRRSSLFRSEKTINCGVKMR